MEGLLSEFAPPRSRAKRNCRVGIFLSTPSQRQAHGTSVDIENSVALRATPVKAQMTYFLCKMILPRSDFIQTMTDSERNIMKAHGDYLQSLAEVGSIVCHGPVDDPKGGWGLSIFSAKDQTEVERLTAADPIILDDVGATYVD
jgi:uncharacterized protein YciI